MTTAISNAVSTKQDTIGYTTENISNKSTSLTSPNDTKYPSTLAVSSALALKEPANSNIQAHISITSGNPHGTTKNDIGLGNVVNVDTSNPSNISVDSSHRFVKIGRASCRERV